MQTEAIRIVHLVFSRYSFRTPDMRNPDPPGEGIGVCGVHGLCNPRPFEEEELLELLELRMSVQGLQLGCLAQLQLPGAIGILR